ncbi:hypothetical protein AAG906_002852 [Vitis piasezkii]
MNSGGEVGVQIQQGRGLPDFLQSVNLKYVKLGYHYLITHLLTLCLIPLMALIIVEASQKNPDDIHQLWLHLQYNLVSIIICSAFLVFGSTVYIMTRPRSIYLVDYACYRPPSHLQVRYHQFMEHSRLTGDFDESALEFRERSSSGLGSERDLCAGGDALYSPSLPWRRHVKRPSSLFNPTPSLSAMIVNKYKLRGNIRSFNLGGMGCSAGVIAVDLAKDMLQVHRNTYAVVVTVLLSNKSGDRRAKYKLVHLVRTHRGADDKAFRCVYQEQDDAGKTGVSLSKDLMAIAGGALKTNITTLGPLVLPISEQLLFFATLVAKKLFNAKVKPYIRISSLRLSTSAYMLVGGCD